MTGRSKYEPSFPPDYVSAATLAHRLDCSKTTVATYVRQGLLPKPLRIGDLVRWRWTDVEKFLESLDNEAPTVANAHDPYLEGLEHGTPPETDD